MQRFQRKHYWIFFPSIQYGCQTMWPINYALTNLHPLALIWPAVLEKKVFEGFWVNSICLPNHVTYQLEINKLVKGCLGERVCKVSPQSVQLFWRRFIYLFIQNNMAAEPCDLWRHNIFFPMVSCCVDDVHEISNFSNAAFYMSNFRWDTTSQMTSWKVALHHGEFLPCAKF